MTCVWSTLPKVGFGGLGDEPSTGVDGIGESDGDTGQCGDLELQDTHGRPNCLRTRSVSLFEFSSGQWGKQQICPFPGCILRGFVMALRQNDLPFSGLCVKQNGKLHSFSKSPVLCVLLENWISRIGGYK